MRIDTPYTHPLTGQPLVISRGIGDGPWMVFAVRPSGSLRRVRTAALPERETPAEVRADLDAWMKTRRVRS